MNVDTYKGPRKALTVRVCPDTYQGLVDAAQDMGCTLQDVILGAVLMEYGLDLYSPDALACPITAGEIDRYKQSLQRRMARLAGPLYRPPEWWAARLKAGTLADDLEDMAALIRSARRKLRKITKTP